MSGLRMVHLGVHMKWHFPSNFYHHLVRSKFDVQRQERWNKFHSVTFPYRLLELAFILSSCRLQ
jgi:hypothetical protein